MTRELLELAWPVATPHFNFWPKLKLSTTSSIKSLQTAQFPQFVSRPSRTNFHIRRHGRQDGLVPALPGPKAWNVRHRPPKLSSLLGQSMGIGQAN